MNWECEKCHQERFKYKVLDLEAMMKSTINPFEDLPKIFAKAVSLKKHLQIQFKTSMTLPSG